MRSGITMTGFLVLLAGACSGSGPTTYTTGGGGGGGNGGGVSASVTIRDFSYSPADDTMQAGGTLTWTNNGPSSHTVTADDGSFDSGTLGPPSGSDPYGGRTSGGSYTMTFPAAGTYAYHCAIHPGMTGTITVQ